MVGKLALTICVRAVVCSVLPYVYISLIINWGFKPKHPIEHYLYYIVDLKAKRTYTLTKHTSR
jgi:hypothetical protein